MTCPRVYREPKDAVEAVAELERNAGTQFDTGIVSVMARLIREGAVQVGEQPRLGTPLADDPSRPLPAA
jgi:HD-GYP domain-containing protein (c-di-GMP phosphodiesterase class II)